MKKNLLLLMLALLLPAFMYGQEQTVSGTVLDTYNMGVPGASIVEKGTTDTTYGQGLDNGRYPTPKTVLLGLSVTF